MSSEVNGESASRQRVWRIVAFFGFIGLSHYLFEVPYNGYLIALVLMFVAALRTGRMSLSPTTITGPKLAIVVGMLLVSCLTTFSNAPDWRDVLRDGGVFLAFMVGRFALATWLGDGHGKDLLYGLSLLGVIDSVATLLAAALAYRAGADAYIWRGAYVPVSHTWLPYLFLSNLTLARLEPARKRLCWFRAGLCVAATLASLSRTDVLLYLIFATVMVTMHRRTLFASTRNFARTVAVVCAAVVFGYAASGLGVVQERIDKGVGDEDQSLGWRLIEDAAMLDYFDESGSLPSVIGFGWGARMPLPAGIVDFDGDDSIPLLHNSFLTVWLKFGIAGVLILLAYITARFRFAWRMRTTPAAPWVSMGAWILLFNIANAITLQGLTQWAQVTFFGIGCGLLSSTHTFIPKDLPAPR